MNDTGWRRNKHGGLFNINDYMNNKIRNVVDYDNDEDRFKTENADVVYNEEELTTTQKNVIDEYTYGTGYGSCETMNGYLNGTKELGPGASEITLAKAEALESAINKPLNREIYVYRKIHNATSEIREGQIIENKGFTSTSITKNKATNLDTLPGTTIKLRVKKGTKALYIGSKTGAPYNEHELLFGKNHSIKITKVDSYEIYGELN